MFGSLLVSPHPASPELLDEELLDAAPPVPLLEEELLDEELLDEELLDEELLDAAPPVPLLDEELLDVEAGELPPPPPLPPATLVWTELPQDEDAASTKIEETTTTPNAERALKMGMIHGPMPGSRMSSHRIGASDCPRSLHALESSA